MAAEAKRGCGYRKIGGLYLCADGPGVPCHRLPIPLEVCPTCHAGIKQTRGWTWVTPTLLGGPCTRDVVIPDAKLYREHCAFCPACTPALLGDKAGLIWIGEAFYKKPEDFTREAMTMGVSRRISTVPRGFKVGEHFVLIAHPKAVKTECACFLPRQDNTLISCDSCDGSGYVYKPGIFHCFKPTRIEKILADTASAAEIKEWGDKGYTVVLLPANDKDHKGTVYDKDEEEETGLPLSD